MHRHRDCQFYGSQEKGCLILFAFNKKGICEKRPFLISPRLVKHLKTRISPEEGKWNKRLFHSPFLFFLNMATSARQADAAGIHLKWIAQAIV